MKDLCFSRRCVDTRLAQELLDRFCKNFHKTCDLGQNRCKKSVADKRLKSTPIFANNLYICRKIECLFVKNRALSPILVYNLKCKLPYYNNDKNWSRGLGRGQAPTAWPI